jgi:GT2 family glycosyltransferase
MGISAGTREDPIRPSTGAALSAAPVGCAGAEDAPLQASVLVCAYTLDRWDDLVDAVSSARHQSRPPREVIVVIDHNDELLERARTVFREATVVANRHEQGLSGARNTGVEEATADVVAFLDDDAVAEHDWLEKLLAPYEADPAVLGVGGWIEAWWPAEARPRMLPPEFDWVVGCSYRGLPESTSPVRNMIGANMSMRRSVLAEVGGFTCDLGRIGTVPLGCEETELCIRARQKRPDGTILLEPAARVRHRVAAVRTGWRYFRARCWAEGLSKAVVARMAGAGDGLASERAHAAKVLPLGVMRGLGEALRGDLAGLLRATAIVAGFLVTAAGYAVGTLRYTR